MKRLLNLGSFLFVASLIPQTSLALEYKISGSFSANQKMVIQNFLNSGRDLLPKTVRDSLDDVEVSFEKIQARDGNAIMGRVSAFSKSRLTLSQAILPDILAGEKNSREIKGRVHKTAYKEALATVLHETIHLYDGLNLHSSEERSWMSRCNPVVMNDKRANSVEKNLPAVCKYYKGMHLTFSQNPYFLFAAGFVTEDNGLKERSPDIYELTNPKESFAVNTEYFLLDPDFKCRRPTMYRVLAGHFKHVPFEGINCERRLNYVLPNSQGETARMLEIDPARVYQVHYLLADKGEAMMSGWGHAMIRLVICAPERKTVGPDCMLDISNHVVLSYRAFVDSLSLSSLDGMTGKYPSRLFIIPLGQVIDEYNKGELRALKSLPLKLSRKEIEDVVTRSVEAHWSYNGRYYFISNNCATESLNLIRSSIFAPDLLQLDVKTPLDLYASFLRLGRADESVLKDTKKALAQGFYFDSYEERYKRAFETLKPALGLPQKDFREFLDLKADQRRAYAQKIKPGMPKVKQISAFFMILESASQRRLQARVTGQVQKAALMEMDRIEKSKSSGQKAASNLAELAEGFLELGKLFAKPSIFLKDESGYGLPSLQESQAAQSRIDAGASRAQVIEKQANTTVQNMISPEDLREMEQLKENIKLLVQLMRS